VINVAFVAFVALLWFINLNKNDRISMRQSFFTSSKIHLLTKEGTKKGTFGKPAITYIEEKYFEHLLGKSLDTDVNTFEIAWGKVIEQYVFDKLPLNWRYEYDKRYLHLEYNWSGAPDLVSTEAVGDVKCPQYKRFVQLSLCKSVEQLKEIAPEYYWQLVSNAILVGVKKASLFVFMPSINEALAIQTHIEQSELENESSLLMRQIERWPFIPENSLLKPMHEISFEIEQADIDFLTEKVKLAHEYLHNLIKQTTL
jgi:hypothetical protein